MYQRILVPFDGSPTSEHGLDEAIRLARLTGARLRLIHVLDDLLYVSGFETCSVYASDVVPFMRQRGEAMLQAARSRAEQTGVVAETLLLEGISPRLSEVIDEQVKSWGADLIVIGMHGRRGIGRLMLGSDAEQVVRTASVPVLLVRGPGLEPAVPAAALASLASFADKAPTAEESPARPDCAISTTAARPQPAAVA
ncbi:universal stress protein [soil metagenome]